MNRHTSVQRLILIFKTTRKLKSFSSYLVVLSNQKTTKRNKMCGNLKLIETLNHRSGEIYRSDFSFGSSFIKPAFLKGTNMQELKRFNRNILMF